MTDAGLAHLAEVKTLRVLDLTNTRVGDDGLEHLKALPRLERVGLSGTRVTEPALRELRAALPDVEITR